MLDKAIAENFMRNQHGKIWLVADEPAEAIQLIRTAPIWDPSIRKIAKI